MFAAIPGLASYRCFRCVFSVFQLMIRVMTATASATIPTTIPTISPVPRSAMPLLAPLGSDATDSFVAVDADDDASVGDAVTKLDRNEVIREEGVGSVDDGEGEVGVTLVSVVVAGVASTLMLAQ